MFGHMLILRDALVTRAVSTPRVRRPLRLVAVQATVPVQAGIPAMVRRPR